MLARTREKAARQKELDAERERQNECVNDDIWKFMDESIDSGAESVLLLTAQIEVIVHIIILAGWIWCLNTRSHTHKQYIYKIYIWMKHKCKLFGVPCSFVGVFVLNSVCTNYIHVYHSISWLLVLCLCRFVRLQFSSIVNNSFAPSIDRYYLIELSWVCIWPSQ